MKHILAACVISLLFFSSCKKDHGAGDCGNSEYFEFGYWGGIAGIKKLYVIRNGQLFPKDSTQPALSTASYNAARVLINDFPTYLWEHPNQNFGQGCCDQFITRIRYLKDGVYYQWDMDNSAGQVPPELRSYVTEVNRIAEQL